jgi:hypothetical protein
MELGSFQTANFMELGPSGAGQGPSPRGVFRVPECGKRDPELHALLALVGALLIGQARVRSLAAAELRQRLAP